MPKMAEQARLDVRSVSGIFAQQLQAVNLLFCIHPSTFSLSAKAEDAYD